MARRCMARGVSMVEVAAVLAVLVAVLAVAAPSIAGARGTSAVTRSMSNLAALGVAHLLYALDFDGRQLTFVKDDLGTAGGNVALYNALHGGADCDDSACQPPLYAGLGSEGHLWGYWPATGGSVMFQPLNFPGPPTFCGGCTGWGNFRVPNATALHAYVNGRFHDPVFFAPADSVVLAHVGPCLDEPYEFVSSCNPGWSSYCMSPAAMWNPQVMRAVADGGFQAPWNMDLGYQAPGLFEARYPSLKTLMLEHSWLQGTPQQCNTAHSYCEPFYFNQGLDSAPATLFYDFSIRLLPNAEVYAADQIVLRGTGGVDGLWHRGTPFGPDGYFIPQGYDGTPLSHHILTTGGILGRDTLGEMPAASAAARRPPRPVWAAPPSGPGLTPVDFLPPPFTPEAIAQ